ncbi:MAG: hypothetical protein ABSG04_16475 [Verrucomicrobiota bacterium]
MKWKPLRGLRADPEAQVAAGILAAADRAEGREAVSIPPSFSNSC